MSNPEGSKVTRRTFLRHTAIAAGTTVAAVVLGFKRVDAQDPTPGTEILNDNNALEILRRLTNQEYTPLEEATTIHRYDFRVNIPAEEVARLANAGHPSPATGISVLAPAGDFGVVNPLGLENGVEGPDNTAAREATIAFTPNADAIAADMTADHQATNEQMFDIENQDSMAFWLTGYGQVEVVAKRRDGSHVIFSGTIKDRAFGAGSTITTISADGLVVDTQDIEGVPAAFQMTAFAYDQINKCFLTTDALEAVYLHLDTQNASDNVKAGIGGATSFIDTDGLGTKDFLDAGFGLLGIDGVRFGGGEDGGRTIAVSASQS